MINLAELPKEKRLEIERDKIAARWAYGVKHREISEAHVLRRIFDIDDTDKSVDMRERFEKYMGVRP